MVRFMGSKPVRLPVPEGVLMFFEEKIRCEKWARLRLGRRLQFFGCKNIFRAAELAAGFNGFSIRAEFFEIIFLEAEQCPVIPFTRARAAVFNLCRVE